MKALLKPFIVSIFGALVLVGLVATLNLQSTTKVLAAPQDEAKNNCLNPGTFFGLKPWHAYLEKEYDDATATCNIKPHLNAETGKPVQLDKLWLIGLAILDDLLRIAGLVAVVFVTVGGIRYMTSSGQPEKTKAALGTITNSVIGLAIALIGAAVVGFIGHKLGGG